MRIRTSITLFCFLSLAKHFACDLGSGSGVGPKRPDDEDFKNGKVPGSSGDFGPSTPGITQSSSTRTSQSPPIWYSPSSTVTRVIFPLDPTPSLSSSTKSYTTTTAQTTPQNELEKPQIVISCSNYKSSSNLLSYEPVCNQDQPHLFSTQQCRNQNCFCVNPKTGAIIIGTTIPSFNRRLSCEPLVFRVSVGFQLKWDKMYGNPHNNLYDDFRKSIISAINNLYNNPQSDYQGNQTAEIIEFRPGSVIADIRLTSIGHEESLKADYQGFKQILDEKINTGQFADHKTVPKHYSFLIAENKQDTTQSKTGSTDSEEYAGQTSSSSAVTKDPYEQVTYNQPNMGDSGGQQNLAAASAGSNLFESPGILAAIVAGGIGGLLFIVLLILYCVYRIRKSDEGSYSLDPAKKAPPTIMYQRAPTREFYA